MIHINEKMKAYGELGFPYEEEAVQVFRKDERFIVLRGDSKNLRNPDYYIVDRTNNYRFRLDPKIRKTPFRKIRTFLGLNPAETVTVDVHKLRSYRKSLMSGTSVFLLFNLQYDELYRGVHYKKQGEYIISMQKILEIAKKYKEKRILNETDHEKGKTMERFYILIEEMGRYDDFLWKKFQIKR